MKLSAIAEGIVMALVAMLCTPFMVLLFDGAAYALTGKNIIAQWDMPRAATAWALLMVGLLLMFPLIGMKERK